MSVDEFDFVEEAILHLEVCTPQHHVDWSTGALVQPPRLLRVCYAEGRLPKGGRFFFGRRRSDLRIAARLEMLAPCRFRLRILGRRYTFEVPRASHQDVANLLYFLCLRFLRGLVVRRRGLTRS